MVERGDDDLVPAPSVLPERAREQEVERRHALPERRLAGRAAEERRGSLVRELDERGRPPARLVGRADVRVVLAEIPRDRLDDLVGALRAAGTVEEGKTPVERGEARSHCCDVECGGAHETS